MPSSFRRSFNRAGGKMAESVVGMGMKELLAQMLETPEVKEEKQLGLRAKRVQVQELEEPTVEQISVPQNLQDELGLPPEIDSTAAPLVAAYISFKKPHLGGSTAVGKTPLRKEVSDVIRTNFGLPAGEPLTPSEVSALNSSNPDKMVDTLFSIENQGIFLSPKSKEQIGTMKQKYIERGAKKYKSLPEVQVDFNKGVISAEEAQKIAIKKGFAQ